ncbi:unnamed protein product [Peronospora destructor]|uniref:Uncharacterized protein n=1 Tax=Peronospora destructor TaxID=86335 RepID=A0AAV0V6E7_9STRA|nr:unnamed protein product [Peronospora destructor]
MDNNGVELRVCSAKLQGFHPFPTWNGTISAPLKNNQKLCSILTADGELVVLQTFQNDDEIELSANCLRVVKILPPTNEKFLSFCQCWANDGSVVVTAHNNYVVFYSSDNFHVLRRVKLCYGVISLDIVKVQTVETKLDDTKFLLLVGTAFGAFLYTILLDRKSDGVDGTSDLTLTPVARVHDGVAVCMVKFSSDGYTAAIGTMDGRLFLRRLDSHSHDTLAIFGTAALSRVLQAPRITGLSFSVCSMKLVVATRKGNVYVFTCASKAEQWQSLPSCFNLNANLKPKARGALGTNKTPASTVQTLVSCWGPVFVVCSRTHASRLEMYDFVSGSLLHSLQLAPAKPVSSAALCQWVDQPLVTGICSMQINDNGRSRLLCQDSSANIAVVEWPFLDALNGSR